MVRWLAGPKKPQNPPNQLAGAKKKMHFLCANICAKKLVDTKLGNLFLRIHPCFCICSALSLPLHSSGWKSRKCQQSEEIKFFFNYFI